MAAAEVRFVGVWNPQRSELSSAAGLGTHYLHWKDQSRRKLSVRAEKTRGVEEGKTLRTSSSNYFLFGRNNVFLILKAVQNGSIGGAQSLIQQMYNLKDIPIPLLDASYSVVNEIKKRMAFPWQEDVYIDSEYQNEQKKIDAITPLDSTQLESPSLLNDQSARCISPRRNDSSPIPASLPGRVESMMGVPELNNQINSDITVQAQTNFTEVNGLHSLSDTVYPRCSWPRKESTGPSCAWPRAPLRAASKTPFQEQLWDSTVPQSAGKAGRHDVGSSAVMKVGESSITNSHSAALRQQKTEDQLDAGPRCGWPKDHVAGKADDAKHRQNPDAAIFPSDFPRRMLATSVGISLMNYLLVGQGTALAFPGDFLHGIDPLPSRKPDLVVK